MGYYTKVYLDVVLRKDLIPILQLFFKRMVEGNYHAAESFMTCGSGEIRVEFDHKFFKCKGWMNLFMHSAFMDEGPEFSERGAYFHLRLRAEFKDYEDEIEKFTDWIRPLVAGHKSQTYIGWYKGEGLKGRWNVYVIR